MHKYSTFWLNSLIFTLLFWGTALTLPTFAQKGKDLIQFSGVVMTSDSLQPVFYASVYNITRKKGELCNWQGFFSVVAERGDKIRFSALGYRTEIITIPKDIDEDVYTIVQLMEPDTIELPEVTVHPWPTPTQFKQAFMDLDLPQSELQAAKENLDRDKIRDAMENLAMDGKENMDLMMRQSVARQYSAGQYQSIQLLNPLAWAQFFKALKRGDFSKKKKTK